MSNSRFTFLKFVTTAAKSRARFKRGLRRFYREIAGLFFAVGLNRRRYGHLIYWRTRAVRLKKNFNNLNFSSATLRLASVILIFGLLIQALFGGSMTNAFFNDTESSANSFGATSLDFELQSPASFTPNPIEKGGDTERTVNVDNVGNLGFKYTAQIGGISGDLDLCGELDLEAKLHGVGVYNGSLSNFLSATSTFDASANDWNFKVSLPSSAPDSILGKTCNFDFVYQGWQTEFDGPESGFSDVETIHNSISSVSSPGAPDVCPFTGGSGKYIVNFNHKLLVSDSSLFGHIYNGFVMASSDGPVAGNLPAGTYDITLASYDNHLDPDKVHQVQLNEQWKLIMNNAAGSQVAETNSIRDIANDEEQVIEKVDTDFVISQDISSFTAMHSAYPSTEPNSLHALCAMFEEKSSSSNDVVINEFLPNPTGDDYALKPNGEWVELYNTSSNSVDVNGWYLYDSLDSHPLAITDANTNTEDTTVPAGGWLVVYLNGAYGSGWLNNSGGDSVRLYNGPVATGQLIDSHFYTGNAAEDKSYARIPDGSSNWVDPIPTPGRPNSLDLSGVEPVLCGSQEAAIAAVCVAGPEEQAQGVEQILQSDSPADEASTTPLESSSLAGQASESLGSSDPGGSEDPATESAAEEPVAAEETIPAAVQPPVEPTILPEETPSLIESETQATATAEIVPVVESSAEPAAVEPSPPTPEPTLVSE